MPKALRTQIFSIFTHARSDGAANMDPYVILTCRTQEQKSSVQTDKGSNPKWNENFIFNVSEGVNELRLKIMDSDSMSADDIVGEVTITLDDLFKAGSIPSTSYNVVKDDRYCGEIRVGLIFKRQERRERGMEEDFGGWKESRCID
ncbi:elicitor-responsive protein 3-like isoform X2 [Vigna umbellata]|uniref:elicitor-responsive protein 3-like isoform X2 n=1 Tax=Vigna umbellata TaxID=87088 RepID=UPI001F5E79C4|nr:elicitor-responsive protein 3-like isoform X2 [Vigna umbellata]